MSLFGGVINITGITFFVMSIFAIIVGGYLIGKAGDGRCLHCFNYIWNPAFEAAG